MGERIVGQNREADKLREALSDMSSRGDIQLAFGRTQQQLMSASMSEAMAVHKFKDLTKQYNMLHSSYRRMEKILEQRLDLLFQVRNF